MFVTSIIGTEEQDFQIYLAKREAARRAKRRKHPHAKTEEVYDVLRDLISPLNYAVKRLGQSRPFPSRTNSQILSQIRRFSAWKKKIPNWLLAEHFAGRSTVYFLGHHQANQSLCCIDLDAQKSLGLGSAEGCRQFADWLCKKFPGCFHVEVSPGGIGIHLYFVLDKGMTGRVQRRQATEVNAVLKTFQTWLRHAAKDFDIEQVEIKGTLPVIETVNGQVVEITSGQYCSLPRSASANDLLALNPIFLDDLAALKLTREERREIPRRASASGGISVSAGEVTAMAMLGQKWVEEYGEVVLPTRHKISAESWKGFLLLVRIHKRAKLRKQQFSTAWAAATWTCLYEQGLVHQAWNPSRWTWLRNWWSAYGQIRWESNQYWYGDEPGVGQACVWDISEECDSKLNDLIEGGDTFLHTKFNQIIPMGNLPFLRPKMVDPPAIYIVERAMKRLRSLPRTA